MSHDKYASIITILHNMEGLSTMTPTLVIGKIVAFEMSRKMGREASSSSKQSIALTCDEHKKMKKKGKQVETGSSEDDDDNQDEASTSSFDDEEGMQIIAGVKKMISKIRSKAVPIKIEDMMFTDQIRTQMKGLFLLR